MRELIGYLVACKGAEKMPARMAAAQFLYREDRANRIRELIGNESIGASVAIGDTIRKIPGDLGSRMVAGSGIDHVPAGSPMMIADARKKFVDDIFQEIAGGFGLLDRGSMCRATGTGARRS
jgi:hypothetical protein